MKKNSIKRFYFLVIAPFLLLSSCLNEDALEKVSHKHKHRFNQEIVSLSKVNHIKPHVDNFVQKHVSKSSSTDYLDLNEDRLLVLSDTQTNYVSYSIGINNTIPANQDYFFDNLHVIEQDQIVIDNFIYRWIPDNPSEIFNLKTFSGKVQKYDLDYQLQAESIFLNGQIQTNKVQITCVFIAFCTCSGVPSYCDCTQPSCPTVFGNYCNTGGGEGEGEGGDGFSDGLGGEGGGGGSSNDEQNDDNIGENGDPLHPVIPLEPLEAEALTPCETLKEQSVNNTEFAQKIDSLKQRVLSTNPSPATTETLINVSRIGEEYSYDVSNSVSVGGGLTMVTGSFSNRCVATIHNHPIGNIPIFSYADIVNYYDNYNFVTPSRKNEYTDYLVCFNGTTYALRMENVTALNTLFAGLDLNTAQGRKDAEKEIEKIQKKHGLNTNQIYDQAMAEELFMNVINDEKLGGGTSINLYRKDADGWGKLVKNGTTITKEPCPQ